MENEPEEPAPQPKPEIREGEHDGTPYHVEIHHMPEEL